MRRISARFADKNTARSERWRLTFLALAIPLGLFAQGTDRGTLLGTVTDASGAVVPGVSITATNVDTGMERKVESNAVGLYSFPNLPVGRYQISGQIGGFQRAVIDNIRLEVGATFRADIALRLGEVASQVQVEATTPLLRTDDAEVSHVIEQKRIVDLPLNGRDFQQLQLLTPGSVNVASFQQSSGLAGGASVLSTNQNLNVSNGGRPGTQLFLIDGGDATNQHARTILVTPNIDQIQEFRFAGSNFSAEYGYGTNVVNVSTKGGTNDIHGAAWYFNRDDSLSARDFFAATTNQLKRHQVGGLIGGPIIKNRSFFLFTYEGQRENATVTTVASVPTERMRGGDLNELGKTIYDPATSRPNERGVAVRTPFPNNTIPQSRIHSVPRLFLIEGGWVPLPNRGGIRNNFVNQPTANADYDGWSIRVDHQLTSKDQLMGRYTYRPAVFPQSQGPYEGFSRPPYNPGGVTKDTDATSAVLSWTHTFNPTTFLDLRGSAGAAHISFNNLNMFPGGDDWVVKSGIQGFGHGISDVYPSFPDQRFTGWTGIVSAGGFDNSEDTRTYSGKISMVRGRHMIKFGSAFRNYVERVNPYGIGSGIFTHNGTFTSSAGAGGDGLADYLLGLPFNANRYIPPGAWHPTFRNSWNFIQDDWQVAPNLTLNLGLRYEINFPTIEQSDGHSSWIASARGGRGAIVLSDESAITPPKDALRSSTRISLDTYRHLLVFADQVGLPRRSFRATNYKQFAPRFGLAWRAAGDMTVRAGYGIYLIQLDGNVETGMTNPPTAVRESAHFNDTDANGVPQRTITNIIRGSAGFNPIPDVRGADPLLDGNAGFGQTQQWNLTVQKLLPGNMSLEVAYVGTKADHLQTRRNINNPLPGPGNIQARRPFQDFGLVSWSEQSSSSIYHAFQSKLERRFSSGLTLLGAFTWSKSLDIGSQASEGITNSRDRRYDRGRSDFDLPLVFVLSSIYELPFYRHSTPSPVLKHLVKGWSVGTILTAQSGFPFTPTWAGNVTNNGEPARPIRVCDGRLDSPGLQRWFDASCFAQPQQFTHGNTGRNILSADGLENLDLSVYKMIDIGERHRIQFRGEFFNVLNHANFSAPGSVINTPAAGIVSRSGPGRIVQFGLKYNF